MQEFIKEYIQNSELVTAAITEALHRLYFDNVGKSLLTDEQKEELKKYYFSMCTKYSSFRVTLTEKAKRYDNKTERITSLFLTDKPEIDLLVKINLQKITENRND